MVKKPVAVVWTPRALADLDRFAAFLLQSQPQLAVEIADVIATAAEVLADQPMLGKPIVGKRFRQLVLFVRKAPYVLRYRNAGRQVVILRIFHGREQRKP